MTDEQRKKNDATVCAECEECWYYYMNSDTENECTGDTMPCMEFEPLPWRRWSERRRRAENG